MHGVFNAEILSSAASPLLGSPVENIPLQAEHHSGRRAKLFAFPPERCSPSDRNAVRIHNGIAFAFDRIPHKTIEGIDEAYLYGSFASNQQDAASDIDVLVIGSPREKDLAQAVGRLERQLGREINYTVLTPKEFGSRRARKDTFLENVWHNKRVSLIGD